MTIRLTEREARRLQKNTTQQPRRRTVRAAAAPDMREPWCKAHGPQNGAERVVAWVPCLPPSVNALHQPDGRGGKYLTPEALTFERWLAAALTPRPVMAAGPYRLTVVVTFGRRGRADADNRIKWSQDCLSRLLNFDDSQIRDVRAVAGYAKDAPACEMVLEVVG